ncbi:glycine betaine ABC transporter substrate-binding protein [Alkalibacillus almallahensis]|uniref:glycine betaine ABC transporter substrate-binding protein n=1 Tax=Alkalibacillus almallahensis TaxID=1379154 RepID=UPI0014225E8A|nr:glycine betaine ABC transporter substrate-binding protein [Alkalibacillus almallahensis]NIK12657.1 glycine betaine/proline transport system substrate-binding protein [Alkalibacillus almallahensis]
MLKGTWKSLGLVAMLALIMVIAACGSSDEGSGSDSEGNGEDTEQSEDSGSDSEGSSESGDITHEGEIELVYVEWATEIASTHVIGKVLEDLGYDVTLTPLDNAVMWQSVASGDADGMVAAWLPNTHGNLYEEHSDSMVELGPNFEGAKIGAVVPEYVEADSLENLGEYGDEFNETFTGIEPGAGVVQATEDAVETYEGLDGWSVQTSSSGAMATSLQEAYENEEPIVVTGWSPHWKFAEMDLKYLEDPEGVYGDAETIETMVREGLEEDMPGAYQVLDNFKWGEEKFNSVMSEIQAGTSPEDAAANFVENNQDLVDEWTTME